MDILFYKTLHLVGIMGFFASVGGMFAAGSNSAARKPLAMLHGISLLILIVAGFGAVSKGGFSFSNGWVIGKICILVLAVLLLPAAKRRWLAPGVVLMAGLILGAAAAWLALYHPF
ncbi:MAG: hypothetical protein H7A55_05935 [Verrucomicrobiaceae bacterium]|nr:hypothetical protein [Verrucomicrobiaceae bacterium]